MIIRKLRLQRAWSQEQLAQLTGLNIRTIQRIERGQKPSLESLKALAAVFEVELDVLRQTSKKESNMNYQAHNDNGGQQTLQHDERQAIEQVKEIKGFYSHLISYAITICMLFMINYLTSPEYYWAIWAALGWGIGIISHGISVFEVFNFFSPEWEKKQIEKRLGRKL